jgi:bacterioferritin-associated ferredoxin
MSRKIIICRCEDVTLQDIDVALQHGYHHIEEVKRYTGLGTGPCQGKSCMCRCALVIASRLGRKPGDIPPFTTRPPLVATPMKYFARMGERDEEHG